MGTCWNNSGSCCLQPRLQAALEPGGQFHLRHEEPGIFHGHPAETVGGQAATGHEQMDVRMVTEIAGPGLEHGGEAEFGAEILGIGGEVLQGAGKLFQQGAIPGFHRGADGFAQLLGDGAGDQEIRDGQEPGALLGEPAGGIVLTATGTGPVIAGVIGEMFPAAGTAIALPAQGGGATAEDGPDGGALFGRDEPPELRRISGPMGREDFGELQATARCNTSRAARVFASLIGVRWV